MLELLIGDESRAENKQEWPAHPYAAATEVEHQESAKQTPEKELKRADQEDMDLVRFLWICATMFLAVNYKDADGYHDKVRQNPEHFPNRIDAFEGYCIKGKSAKKRDRR